VNGGTRQGRLDPKLIATQSLEMLSEFCIQISDSPLRLKPGPRQRWRLRGYGS
jgi:hypothetical protein